MLSQEGTATADGDRIDAAVFGGEYSAELSADGKLLTWSNGDVWSFLAPHPVDAGRRKAVGADESLGEIIVTTTNNPVAASGSLQ